MNAQIVVDLGFGDGGKGITTDYLCSKSSNPIVVRFSGGQQAGHTVVLDGKKHVHASYGSGTLRGVPSYFSEHCSIFLPTMVEELKLLWGKRVSPILYVHPLAKVTTPYDVAYNRLKERILNHGSCGLGIAATMKRHLETGYKLFAIDLTNYKLLEQKCVRIKAYYEQRCRQEGLSLDDFFEEYHLNEHVFFDIARRGVPFVITDYNKLKDFEDIIFEGSQGVMLDMDHGIFPNVTFANTTSKNAMEIYSKLLRGLYPNLEVFYVTRCYQTRHGAGWMSNEQQIELINNEGEINVHNEWQKDFRVGELDYDLLNYAMEVDNLYITPIKRNLVVTCLDQRPDFQFNVSKIEAHLERVFHSYSPESKDFKIM
jgi:adenylosuccinate synthase